MKRIASLFTGLALILSLATIAAATIGCSPIVCADWRPVTVRRIGHIVREQRAVAKFDEVDVSGAFYLEIRQGDQESLLIEADEALLPYIRSEIRAGRLKLGYTCPLRLVNSDQLVRLELTVKDLDAIRFSGAGKIYAEQLDTDSIRIELSGAGQIVIDNIEADRLKVKLSGAGEVRLAGVVAEQDVQISGVGNYGAGALRSQDADVRISGVGQATVWVEDTLTANGTTPVSRIQVYGQPRLLSGSAQVVLLDRN